MGLSQVKFKIKFFCVLLSLSLCKSKKKEDDKKIDLPCRHVNHIKC